MISVLVILAMALGLFYTGKLVKEQEKQEIFDYTRTLHIWYADENLTDYLSSVAVKYNEEYGVRVIPVLQTGLEFLENINKASLTQEATPDLYIATNDNMEKAWLAGLTAQISDPDNIVSSNYFSESAINAVTYQGMLLGYPFYYETSALLYNRTYFENLAREEIQEELEEAAKAEQEKAAREAAEEIAAEEAGEEETSAETTVEEGNTSEETMTEGNTSEEAAGTEAAEVISIPEEELIARASERVASMIPDTFDELLEFADNYEAPENVEAVFRWDVSDIFFNYFFIGNYIDIGGACGDNIDSISMYNLEAIQAMKAYQDLGQYFAIEADAVDYETVIQDFIEGKIVMTTATTDIVKKLEEAKAAGEFSYDYGIAPIPDLNEEMKTKNLSVTSTIYVNGYSQLKEEANDFATYLIRDHAKELYAMTGKVTANKQIQQENENVSAFMGEYEDSVPMPKMVTTSNLWVDMEIVFGKIWEGSEVSTELMLMSERLMTKVTREPYFEEYIEMPEESEEYYEFVDDEGQAVVEE